jgi:hypothetical protein
MTRASHQLISSGKLSRPAEILMRVRETRMGGSKGGFVKRRVINDLKTNISNGSFS